MIAKATPSNAPRRRRAHLALCSEGWYYLAVMGIVLLAASLRQINLMMLVYGMLAGPLLLSWRLVRVTLQRLEVRRRLPEYATAGDLVAVDLEVRNGRQRLASWALLASDSVQCTSGGQHSMRAEVLFNYIPAQQQRRGVYRWQFPRRGTYRFGPLELSTRVPLGLLRNTVRFDYPESLTVYPRLGRLQPAWNRWQHTASQGAGRVARGQDQHEGDFYGMRDWRSGDSRQRIHWRTSARRQSLVVRQFEQQRREDVTLVLDLWQPARPSQEDRARVEQAVSMAATIIAEQCNRGSRQLRMAVADGKTAPIAGPASQPVLHEALRTLAVVEAATNDHLPGTLQLALRAAQPGTSVIVISTRPVDLAETSRFASLWNDSKLRRWLARVHVADASSPQWDDYFAMT